MVVAKCHHHGLKIGPLAGQMKLNDQAVAAAPSVGRRLVQRSGVLLPKRNRSATRSGALR